MSLPREFTLGKLPNKKRRRSKSRVIEQDVTNNETDKLSTSPLELATNRTPSSSRFKLVGNLVSPRGKKKKNRRKSSGELIINYDPHNSSSVVHNSPLSNSATKSRSRFIVSPRTKVKRKSSPISPSFIENFSNTPSKNMLQRATSEQIRNNLSPRKKRNYMIKGGCSSIENLINTYTEYQSKDLPCIPCLEEDNNEDTGIFDLSDDESDSNYTCDTSLTFQNDNNLNNSKNEELVNDDSIDEIKLIFDNKFKELSDRCTYQLNNQENKNISEEDILQYTNTINNLKQQIITLNRVHESALNRIELQKQMMTKLKNELKTVSIELLDCKKELSESQNTHC